MTDATIDLIIRVDVERLARAEKRERDAFEKLERKHAANRRHRLKPYSRNRRHVINELLDGLADHYDADIESDLLTE